MPETEASKEKQRCLICFLVVECACKVYTSGKQDAYNLNVIHALPFIDDWRFDPKTDESLRKEFEFRSALVMFYAGHYRHKNLLVVCFESTDKRTKNKISMCVNHLQLGRVWISVTKDNTFGSECKWCENRSVLPCQRRLNLGCIFLICYRNYQFSIAREGKKKTICHICYSTI